MKQLLHDLIFGSATKVPSCHPGFTTWATRLCVKRMFEANCCRMQQASQPILLKRLSNINSSWFSTWDRKKGRACVFVWEREWDELRSLSLSLSPLFYTQSTWRLEVIRHWGPLPPPQTHATPLSFHPHMTHCVLLVYVISFFTRRGYTAAHYDWTEAARASAVRETTPETFMANNCQY